MNPFFHFNANNEIATSLPYLKFVSGNDDHLLVFTALQTDSYEANLIILHSKSLITLPYPPQTPQKILTLHYFIQYKPKTRSNNTAFKFFSYKIHESNIPLSNDNPIQISNYKDFDLIRHRSYIIQSNQGLGNNLTDVPFINPITQNNIPEVNDESLEGIIAALTEEINNENPIFITTENGQELIDKLSKGDFIITDSCTIPPKG